MSRHRKNETFAIYNNEQWDGSRFTSTFWAFPKHQEKCSKWSHFSIAYYTNQTLNK